MPKSFATSTKQQPKWDHNLILKKEVMTNIICNLSLFKSDSPYATTIVIITCQTKFIC